jgi:hypothetical protein
MGAMPRGGLVVVEVAPAFVLLTGLNAENGQTLHVVVSGPSNGWRWRSAWRRFRECGRRDDFAAAAAEFRLVRVRASNRTAGDVLRRIALCDAGIFSLDGDSTGAR